MEDVIHIKIVKWSKYNPRTDRTSSTWFRMNHNLFGHHSTRDYTASDYASWLYLLSITSEANQDHIQITPRACTIIKGLRPDHFVAALKKFERNGWVEILPPSINLQRTTATNVTNERTDVTNDCEGGAKAPSPAPKVKRTKVQSEPTPVARVREAFLDSYRREFGKDYPGWGAPENGKAAQWLKSVSLEKALEYCRFYPKWNEPWVTKRGHTFGQLVSGYVQLDAWLTRPDTLAAKIASGRAAERVMTESETRLAEMKAHAQRNQAQSVPEPAALGADQRLGELLPPSAEVRVPHKLREAPDDQAPFAFADRKAYASGS